MEMLHVMSDIVSINSTDHSPCTFSIYIMEPEPNHLLGNKMEGFDSSAAAYIA